MFGWVFFFVLSLHEAEFHLYFFKNKYEHVPVGALACNEGMIGNSCRVLFSNDHLDIFPDLKCWSS